MKILTTAPIPGEAYLKYAKDFDMTVPKKALSYEEVAASVAHQGDRRRKYAGRRNRCDGGIDGGFDFRRYARRFQIR